MQKYVQTNDRLKPFGFDAVPLVGDELPIIGRAPNQRNLVIASGHGMSGISMATGTGKLVTEIITGRKPHIDPAAFGVNRF